MTLAAPMINLAKPNIFYPLRSRFIFFLPTFLDFLGGENFVFFKTFVYETFSGAKTFFNLVKLLLANFIW